MVRYKRFQVEQRNQVTVIHLVNPSLYDRIHDAQVIEDVMELVEEHHPKRLLLNFAAVECCPSELTNGLIRTQNLLRAYRGQLKLCGMHDTIRKVFQTLKLDGTIFSIHDSLSDAIAAF